jgi:hypothetical protein
MRLPEIGETVTTEYAKELCYYFGLHDIVNKIKSNPGDFKPWKFDGCSCLPDQLIGLFTGCDWKAITYKCCLPHDLEYAYGEPGAKEERKMADKRLKDNLIMKAGMVPWLAKIFYTAVRAGGSEHFGLSFSWSFARQ